MHVTDTAIILSVRKFGENSAIVTALSAEHGRISGVCKAAFSSKTRGIYQPGNKVHLRWAARLPEHLGTLSAELLEGVTAYLMDSRLKLAALSSAASLLERVLPEREPVNELFTRFSHWTDALKDEGDWLKSYVFLELALLRHAGFGLDLSECAATRSTQNLVYVSPKSGCAVSAEAGLPYHDRMLSLPSFLLEDEDFRPLQTQQIVDGMHLTGYFLERRVFEMQGGRLPEARQQFLGLLASQSQKVKELAISGA